MSYFASSSTGRGEDGLRGDAAGARHRRDPEHLRRQHDHPDRRHRLRLQQQCRAGGVRFHPQHQSGGRDLGRGRQGHARFFGVELAIRGSTSPTGASSDGGGQTFNVQIAFGTRIENAIGGGGDDSPERQCGGNVLRGGGGNDRLNGGGGSDTRGRRGRRRHLRLHRARRQPQLCDALGRQETAARHAHRLHSPAPTRSISARSTRMPAPRATTPSPSSAPAPSPVRRASSATRSCRARSTSTATSTATAARPPHRRQRHPDPGDATSSCSLLRRAAVTMWLRPFPEPPHSSWHRRTGVEKYILSPFFDFRGGIDD